MKDKIIKEIDEILATLRHQRKGFQEFRIDSSNKKDMAGHDYWEGKQYLCMDHIQLLTELKERVIKLYDNDTKQPSQ